MVKKKTSPQKVKLDVFSFDEAIKQVILNKKISRVEWDNKNEYGYLKDSWLTIHKPDGTDYVWTVSDGDVLATDWFLIN